jgi:hypothetical protein
MEKKYKLKIKMLTGEEYESKEYDGDILLGITLIDFVNTDVTYSGCVIFNKDQILLGYDIPATENLKNIKIDLGDLLAVFATYGPLHGKNRFGLLKNIIAMFNSNLKWPPFDLDESEDPISCEQLGVIDIKNVKTVNDFFKEKNGLNNTNAPNLMIIEFNGKKDGKEDEKKIYLLEKRFIN